MINLKDICKKKEKEIFIIDNDYIICLEPEVLIAYGFDDMKHINTPTIPYKNCLVVNYILDKYYTYSTGFNINLNEAIYAAPKDINKYKEIEKHLFTTQYTLTEHLCTFKNTWTYQVYGTTNPNIFFQVDESCYMINKSFNGDPFIYNKEQIDKYNIFTNTLPPITSDIVIVDEEELDNYINRITNLDIILNG